MFGANANSPKYRNLDVVSDMKCVEFANEHYACLVLLKKNRFTATMGAPHFLVGLEYAKSHGKWVASPENLYGW